MANKFAYNKNYYMELAKKNTYDGNAVRKLDYADPDEELLEEEEYDEYLEEQSAYEEVYRTEQESQASAEKKQKVRLRRVVKIDAVFVLMFIASVCAVVFYSYKMLRIESDIDVIERQISKAEMKLDDVNALNASLSDELDTAIDRNYIYNVAVQRFNMVYPNDNMILTYKAVDSGYVRQMSLIP